MNDHDPIEDRIQTKHDIHGDLLQNKFEADPASFVKSESGIADVGMIANYLIRQALEDAEHQVPSVDPLDLVAERLGLEGAVLRVVAMMTESELEKLDELDPETGPAYREAIRRVRTIVEQELEMSRRLISGPSGSRLIGAGIDPQMSDQYRQWLTHVESALTRVPRYIEDPDERQMDDNLIPDGVESDMHAYDGTDGGNTLLDELYEYDDLANRGLIDGTERNRFWFRASDICDYQGKTVTTLQTVRDVLEAMGKKGGLKGLWAEIAACLRRGEGVADWKIITRREDKQLKKAEDKVNQVWRRWNEALQGNDKSWDWLKKQLDEYVSCGWSRVPWTATVTPRTDDQGHPLPLKAQDLKAPQDHSELRWQSDLCFIKFKKWVQGEEGPEPITVSKFAPKYSRYYGTPEIVETPGEGLPKMHPIVRLIDGIHREARRKGKFKTGLLWISKSALPDRLQSQIQLTLQPGLINWTVSVWFDPYDSGYIEEQATLRAADLEGTKSRDEHMAIINGLAQIRIERDSQWYKCAVDQGLSGPALMESLFGPQKKQS
jgi:hypothetical protein